jgi:hypothetical protein
MILCKCSTINPFMWLDKFYIKHYCQDYNKRFLWYPKCIEGNIYFWVNYWYSEKYHCDEGGSWREITYYLIDPKVKNENSISN